MTEVFSMLGLAALAGVLLGSGSLLLSAPFAPGTYSWWRWRAPLWAGSVLCLTWANFVLGSSLAPRYLHGSALHPNAGMARDGTYYVIDQFERRQEVSATGFWQRHSYEQWSRWLPWGLTPAALLVLILCVPRGDRYQSIRLRPNGEGLLAEYD
jgi:hypothetical protein